MQPRTLDQIMASLGSVYDPQINSIRQRQNEIPNQLKADEDQLAGKQTQAYEDILNGARSRGMGFSGIPLGEQAKYNSTVYMPELARARSSARTNAISLEDAIHQINERRMGQSQSIYQYEQDFAESKRRFDEQAAQQAAAGRAAASGAPDFSSILQALNGGQQQGGADQFANVDKDRAKRAMDALFNTKNVATIAATLNAIKKSASYKDPYDTFKLSILDNYMAGGGPTAALIRQALNYKAPAAKPSTVKSGTPSGAYPTVKQVVPSYGIPGVAPSNFFNK